MKTNLKLWNSWTVNIYSYTIWNCSKRVLKLECTKNLSNCIFNIYLYRFGWVFRQKKNAFLNYQQFSLIVKNILPLMMRGKFHYYLTFTKGEIEERLFIFFYYRNYSHPFLVLLKHLWNHLYLKTSLKDNISTITFLRKYSNS